MSQQTWHPSCRVLVHGSGFWITHNRETMRTHSSSTSTKCGLMGWKPAQKLNWCLWARARHTQAGGLAISLKISKTLAMALRHGDSISLSVKWGKLLLGLNNICGGSFDRVPVSVRTK